MEQELLKPRHSLAHILAQAAQQIIDPFVALGTGPAIDNGFYYDMLFSDGVAFSEEHLKDLTKTMQGIVKQNQSFVLVTARDKEEALHILDRMAGGSPHLKERITHLLGGDTSGRLGATAFKKELVEKFTLAAQQEGRDEATYTFWCNCIPVAAAEKLLAHAREGYKEIYEDVTNYLVSVHAIDASQFVTFIDLCEGPHVSTTKEIADGSFILEKIAGAYWQANENNPQMTRIYGLAFETKDELKAYQTMMEEAKKRDHRVLGEKLKIFSISQLVGSGLPLFHPNGTIIRKELEEYLRSLHKTRGYDRIRTPHLAKEDLYKVSGHAGHYLDDMFSVHGGTSKEDFYVKPMNCPHHMQIFAANQFSYRDMPIRYFEPATVYRDEKTGQLAGLTRVRSITQDDGHLFCRLAQIPEEVATIVHIIKEFYTTMGMLDGYRVRLSLRGDDKEHYLGSDEVWEAAESALTSVCEKENLPYKPGKGEAAFYGPKLDFMFKDAIGRERQLATCQLDFNLPERFDLSFVNEQGEKERPVVIHRAISGSLERFIGVMIEHFAGAFPLWLAPTQIMIIPVSDKFIDTCVDIKNACTKEDLRVKIDTSDDSFAKKIRNAELEKIPYIAIIGEKEIADHTVSFRVYKTKEQGTLSLDEFIAARKKEYTERAL